MNTCLEKCMVGFAALYVLGWIGQIVLWNHRSEVSNRSFVLLTRSFVKNSNQTYRKDVKRPKILTVAGRDLSSKDTRNESLLRPVPYHTYWDINCSAVFEGNRTVIGKAHQLIFKERARRPSMPLDSTVVSWTQDCAVYKTHRGYPRLAHSDEEASFPLAYIIVTHKGSAQVERLLRAIYQPQNIYCIHPDSKSSGEFHQAIAGLANCFDNVFIASKIENVQYAGFTRLLADINCMKDLTGPRASAYPWKYAINLCGQDFPLKTNLEIVRQLKAYNGHNDINGGTPTRKKIRRTKYAHKVRGRLVVRTKKLKSPAPHNLTVYTGSAYYAVTRDFINYTLRDPVAQDFLQWVGDTYSPDEAFWASLQRAPGVPGGDAVDKHNSVRYVRWMSSKETSRCRGRYVRQVCVFGTGDLPHLIKQPQLFVNKFDYRFDPVTMQCLEGALEFRVRHPEESEKLADFPVRYSKHFSHPSVVMNRSLSPRLQENRDSLQISPSKRSNSTQDHNR